MDADVLSGLQMAFVGVPLTALVAAVAVVAVEVSRAITQAVCCSLMLGKADALQQWTSSEE